MLTTILPEIFYSLQTEHPFESLCDVRYFPPASKLSATRHNIPAKTMKETTMKETYTCK